jgi:hypothetical protein
MGLDSYSFRARWLPCVLVAAPLVLAAVSWLPTLHASLLASVPVLAAVAMVLAHLTRNKGRDLQTQLWKKWGGAPTTLVLRDGSERIPCESLARYRRFFGQIAPDVRLPTTAEETAAPPGAFDGTYTAATSAVINRTRSKTEFSQLYFENVGYGFWRNLLALRRLGIPLAVLALIVAAARIAVSPSLQGHRLERVIISMLVSISFLVFFVIVLSEDQVKRAGFNYAERLIEASEQLVAGEGRK